MLRRLGLLVLDRRDGVGQRGATANVASLVIAIVITGGVAQHVIERIRPDLCALPISVGHEIGVHRGIPFLCAVSASRRSQLKSDLLDFLAQKEANDAWPAPAATGRPIRNVQLGGAIPVGDVAGLRVLLMALGLS